MFIGSFFIEMFILTIGGPVWLPYSRVVHWLVRLDPLGQTDPSDIGSSSFVICVSRWQRGSLVQNFAPRFIKCLVLVLVL